jgi:hypothetical protein
VLYFSMTIIEHQEMLSKIHSIQFNSASAAVSAEAWPMNEVGLRAISGCVTLRIEGVIERTNNAWASNDLRKGEVDLVGLVMHRLSTFEALERERDALKAALDGSSEVGK